MGWMTINHIPSFDHGTYESWVGGGDLDAGWM